MKTRLMFLAIVSFFLVSNLVLAQVDVVSPPGAEQATIDQIVKLIKEMPEVSRPKVASVVLTLSTNLLGHSAVLRKYGAAWDALDIEGILSLYPDTGFIYIDPFVPKGITEKSVFRAHLVSLFKRYPKQTWTTNAKLYPGTNENELASSYEFKMFRQMSAVTPALKGTGMDTFVFNANKQLISTTTYLSFDK